MIPVLNIVVVLTVTFLTATVEATDMVSAGSSKIYSIMHMANYKIKALLLLRVLHCYK